MMKITVKNPNATQFQIEYGMYMMLASYFAKCTCRTRLLEERLNLFYKDLRENKQYEVEEACERAIEKKILPELVERLHLDTPEQINNIECQMAFKNAGDHHILHFMGENFEFYLEVTGNSHKIDYRLVA